MSTEEREREKGKGELLSISVQGVHDGRRYRVLVKEDNFSKLKVLDIKHALRPLTGLEPCDQDISINGALLSDSWTAVDFGLHPFCQLTLSSKFIKNNNKTAPPSLSPSSLPPPPNPFSSSPSSSFSSSYSSSVKEREIKKEKERDDVFVSPPVTPLTLPPPPPSIFQEYHPQGEAISVAEHEKMMKELELSWKHRLNNETRKFLEEKKGMLKTANQDREHLLNENHKLRALLGDEDLVAFSSKSQPTQNASEHMSFQEKLRLEDQIQILQSQLRKSETDKYELNRKLSEEKELNKNQRLSYEEERKNLLSTFVEEKNKMLSVFAQEKSDWVEKTKIKFSQLANIGNNSQKEMNSENDDLQKLNFEVNDWETEKIQILKNWSEETEVLTLIFDAEKQKWEAEKEELIKTFDEEKATWTEQAGLSASLSANKVHQLQKFLKTTKEKEEQLQVRLAQVRKVADERAMIAQAAQRTLEDLKGQWGGVKDGSIVIAQAVVSATNQKNIEIQKVERLLLENDQLSARVKEEIMLRTLLSDKLDDILGRVRIVCRCRPLLSSEVSNQSNPSLISGESVVECLENQVVIKSGLVSLAPSQLFDFSCVLGPSASQKETYDEVLSFVQSFCDGQNVLVSNYGHTGSGKSFTLFGGAENNTQGIIPRAVDQIFAVLKHTAPPSLSSFSHPSAAHSLPPTYEWFLDCSVIEVYTDEIFDLLSSTPDKPVLNFHFSKCTQVPFTNQADVLRVISSIGKKRQITGTSISPRNSNSHLMVVFQLRPESIEYDEFNNKHSVSIGGDIPSCKLVFLDLAGSEHMNNATDTQSQKLKADMLALGYIIQTLHKRNNNHDSKPPSSSLTTTLQECAPLDNKSKILLYANISPSAVDLTETVHTLSFATEIKSSPAIPTAHSY